MTRSFLVTNATPEYQRSTSVALTSNTRVVSGAWTNKTCSKPLPPDDSSTHRAKVADIGNIDRSMASRGTHCILIIACGCLRAKHLTKTRQPSVLLIIHCTVGVRHTRFRSAQRICWPVQTAHDDRSVVALLRSKDGSVFIRSICCEGETSAGSAW